MKIIKFFLMALFAIAISSQAEAQIFKKIQKAVERGVEDAVERKVRNKTEDKTEEVLDTIMGNGKKSKHQSNPVYEKENDNPQNTPETQKSPETESGSLEEEDSLLEEEDHGSSFKRGNIILYEDNFSRDAVGDFPAKWNSAQGGEVKRLKGFEENWLKIPAGSVVNLEMAKPLPANFTTEFDVIIPKNIPLRMAAFAFGEKPKRLGYTLAEKDCYTFMFYSKSDYKDAFEYGLRGENNLKRFSRQYNVPLDKKVHVGIVVNNNQRIRLFLDGMKIVDAPNGFNARLSKAFFFNAMTHGGSDSKKNYFYISNVLITESGIDKRSLVTKELIEKGTFTTSDILFDSGSDKIQTSSANILNQIGEAMKTAPSAQFLIIGHTDSDGSDSANQTLSQKRAQSVKNYLVENFGIDANKLMCVGKGESEPVAGNETPSGKAKNRRVEFKKL